MNDQRRYDITSYINDEMAFFTFQRSQMAAGSSSSSPLDSPLEASLEADKILSVLDIGLKFTYKIPSFPVVSIDLRTAKLQMVEENGSVLLCDGFI